ncbi:MAG: hypothetical protein mread185_000626 [Mycoplasmataceae bacterium]|nr:MAG: hypothetical protein mread185_000626 [Mycoplasmataceae bacterium]
MERLRKKWGEDFEFRNSEYKYRNQGNCCFCNEKIDRTKWNYTARSQGRSWNFCSLEFHKSAEEQKKQQRSKNDQLNNLIKFDNNSKCSVCGITYDERKNNSWTQISFNEGPIEEFCGGCSENKDKYRKIKSEQTRLDELRSQIQKPENSSKKKELENQIRETESNLNRLKEESKNQQQKNQLQRQITELENKSNRTPQEEQDLADKKKKLEKLSKQINVQVNNKNVWKSVLMIVSIFSVGLIICLIFKNKNNRR